MQKWGYPPPSAMAKLALGHARLGPLDQGPHRPVGQLARLAVAVELFVAFEISELVEKIREKNELRLGEGLLQILKIIDLMDKGYADQIVVTSDLNTANRRTVHGGHGYHYLLANIVPRMRANGMDDDAIETLFVRNPQRALTYGT